MTLFDKIMNTTVSNTSRISDDDVQYCEEMQRQYNALLDNLLYWETLYTEHLTKTFGSGFSITKYSNGRRYASVNFEATAKLGDIYGYIHTPEKGLNDVFNIQEDAPNKYKKEIIDHFNSKYNLDVSWYDFHHDYTQPLHYNVFIDYIFNQLNGLSLHQYATELFIQKVQRYNEKWQKPAHKLQGNKLSLYFDASLVYDAMMYFDHQERYNQEQVLPMNKNYGFDDNHSKIKGYRNFTEHTTITFMSEQYAQDFITMFRFNEPSK